MPHDSLEIELLAERPVYYPDIVSHLRFLEREIEIIKSRFEYQETGRLRTAVNVLEERVKEIETQIRETLARK